MNVKYDYERIVQGILDIGEAMIRCGAENFRLQDSLYRICRSYGFVKYDIFVIPSNIQITAETPEGQIITQIRLVEIGECDFDKLDYLNNLCRKVCKEKPDAKEMRRQFEEVMGRPEQKWYTHYAAGILGGTGFAVFFGSLSSCIMYQPRIEYAMAKDNLFFKSFAKVHPKYETPYFSIIVQCAVAIVLIFATNLSGLLGYFTMVALLKNLLTFLTIFPLRKKGKENGYDPAYKCPGGAIMPIIAIFTYAPMQSLLCAFIAVATGLPVFYYWDKKNKKTNNSEV